MNEVVKKPNRRMMFLLLAVFALPVILAKLALENEWFTTAATNKGELLNPILDFSPISDGEQHKWRIVYLLPEICEATCENALYSINQVWIALGKEMDRAEALVVKTEQSDGTQVEKLESHPVIGLITTNQQSVNQVFNQVSTDGIFVVDTLGNVILRYPLQLEQQQAVLHSREILADLRKLLKLSRIG